MVGYVTKEMLVEGSGNFDFNMKNEKDNLENTYSFFYDFPAELQVYDVRDTALKEIFERITQDIFNDTLARW